MLSVARAIDMVAIDKKRFDESVYLFPLIEHSIDIPVVSCDNNCLFLFDINRKSRNAPPNILRCVYINKHLHEGDHYNILRLDTMGIHENPTDINLIPPELPFLNNYLGWRFNGPHLHLYNEDINPQKTNKWAIPVPAQFTDLHNLYNTCIDFFIYNNIESARIPRLHNIPNLVV